MRSPDLVAARTQPIVPQATPPRWLDLEQVQAGLAFFTRYAATMQQVLGTSSLAATFAARDIAPVLMQTRRLAREFGPRMEATQGRVGVLVAPFTRLDTFLKNNYAAALALGELHQSVAQSVAPALRWNPRERIPLSQQAYAFVLYTFAWWPLEALLAKKQLDPVRDTKAIGGWLHLWSVLGYGMGTSEALLPKDLTTAQDIAKALRKAQYARAGEAIPEGVPTLLAGQVRYVAGVAAASLRSGKPADEKAVQAFLPVAARLLLDQIQLSPGEAEALGLGNNPAQLLDYVRKAGA